VPAWVGTPHAGKTGLGHLYNVSAVISTDGGKPAHQILWEFGTEPIWSDHRVVVTGEMRIEGKKSRLQGPRDSRSVHQQSMAWIRDVVRLLAAVTFYRMNHPKEEAGIHLIVFLISTGKLDLWIVEVRREVVNLHGGIP